MVLPRTNHRVGFLRKVKNRYDKSSFRPLVNDFGSSAGLLGLAGLVAAGLALLARRERPGETNLLGDVGNPSRLRHPAGHHRRGGVAVRVFRQREIRCYDRISVMLAFLGITAFAILLDRLLALCRSPATQRLGWAACLVAAAFGVYEQTSSADVPTHGVNRESHEAFAAFAEEIEPPTPRGGDGLPDAGDRLPGSRAGGRHEYLRPLPPRLAQPQSARQPRGIMGRPSGKWLKELSNLPLEELAEKLAVLGFEGIHLDRSGLVKDTKKTEDRLRALLDSAPLECGNGRDLFFRLRLMARLRRVGACQQIGQMGLIGHISLIRPICPRRPYFSGKIFASAAMTSSTSLAFSSPFA